MSKKTVWSFFIDNHKFTALLVLGLVAFGIISAVQLPKESDPEVKIPIAVISTSFPGASVEEVEELITNEIEDRITGVDDIEVITSNSSRGFSSIVVEFDPNADEKEVINDLKDKIDLVKGDLPDDANDPVVQQVSFDDEPFLILSLAGPYDTSQLKLYADILETEIERISGVNDVEIVGGREREIQVIVDKARLETFGISLSQVTQAISQSNSDIPIGSIETAGEDFALRFAGRLASATEVASVPVGSREQVPILVSDVARVIDTYSTPDSYSFLGLEGQGSPNPAVTLRVFKAPGGDITRLSAAIKQRIQDIATDQFPENVVITDVQDTAEYIREDLSSLTKNGIATVIIVVTLLLLFIGWREALMAGLSIPMAFLMTFIGLTILDISINFMTLFSLILALGILVDSAIVINEGLSKHRKAGKDSRTAAIDTIVEFQYPLMSGTLTTIFAFVPMLLTGGIIGEYIKTIPITVTLVLGSSLFIALAIVTTFSAFAFRKNDVSDTKKFAAERIFDSVKQSYAATMERLLHSGKARKQLVGLLAVLFIATYALPFTGLLRVELFPGDDFGFFTISVEEPFGTTLEDTRDTVLAIAEELQDDERITDYVINIGPTAHTASILVNLLDKADRDESSTEIIDAYRAVFAAYEEDITIGEESTGPPGAAPVEIKIEGNDLEVLDELAAQFEGILETIPGTTNVDNSVVETNGQFVFYVDRVRAEQFGASATQVALILRNAINGTEATEITQDGEEVSVVVKYDLNTSPGEVVGDTSITDIATIEGITIATPFGEVPVKSFVDIRLENSRANIEHEDGSRIVKVRSDVEGNATPLEIFAAVQKRMDQEIDIPADVIVTLGGENEDTQESFSDMLRAMGVAIILIAGLMVLQFKSFRQSILIIITIPLALIGVFPGLLLVNQPISFPGVIGIVALAGIVVNNAIILIDKINTNRQEGMPMDEAIADAGLARIEPIVLTTITTIFGILPLALTQAVWASLGYSIIFGLLFSTVTTLIVIPVLYQRLYRRQQDQ